MLNKTGIPTIIDNESRSSWLEKYSDKELLLGKTKSGRNLTNEERIRIFELITKLKEEKGDLSENFINYYPNTAH